MMCGFCLSALEPWSKLIFNNNTQLLLHEYKKPFSPIPSPPFSLAPALSPGAGGQQWVHDGFPLPRLPSYTCILLQYGLFPGAAVLQENLLWCFSPVNVFIESPLMFLVGSAIPCSVSESCLKVCSIGQPWVSLPGSISAALCPQILACCRDEISV